MTQVTSSHSAKDTPKTDEKPDTNGIPPTGQTSGSTFDLMVTARGASQMSDARYRTWNMVAKIKHIIGWHTFVPLEEWDLEAGSYQYIGRTCWRCEVTL